LANLFSPLKKLSFPRFYPLEDDIETFFQQAYSRDAMKTVRCLAALLFGAGLFPLPADDDNPAANNPDATPRAYAETPRRSSANSTATAPRPASTANNDWLVRAYEEQLQARSLADGGNQNNNLYSEITSSEELARAAGLSPAQTVKPADAASLHTGSTGGTPSLTLRHDATAAPASPRGDGDLAHSTGLQFKPFPPLLPPRPPRSLIPARSTRPA
jgi:hypothetical protein